MGKKIYTSRYADERDKKLKKKNDEESRVLRALASYSREDIKRKLSDFRNAPKSKKDPTGRDIFANVQAKLQLSQPQDAEEVQADKVAEGVMKGDTDHSKKALSEKTGNDINAKGEGDVSQTSDVFDAKLQSTKGQGQKLDQNTKGELEQHTGTDLSGVNIHTYSDAGKMSEDINAKAFTHGQDIYFKESQYNPNSKDGKELLAHEVAHTVQQGEGKIQRQRTATTRLIDTGEAPHAEGKFHGDKTAGGYIITPSRFPITETYYKNNPSKKREMETEYPATKLLYNTYYSLAQRFMVRLDKLIEVNKGIKPEQIASGKKIIIPYAPLAVETIPMKIIPLLPTTIPQMQLRLPPIELQYGPVVTPSDHTGYAKFKEKVTWKQSDVQTAAYNIIKDNPRVMNALIFLGKIKTYNPNGSWDDWEKELNKFLKGGEYEPAIDIIPGLPYTGNTPETNINSTDLNQTIELRKENSFSVAVSTYLHELNHYIDIWYESEAAKNEEKSGKVISRSGSEYKHGIKPISKDQKVITSDTKGTRKEVFINDPTKEEQQSGLTEYLTNLTEQILRDMQQPIPQPDEHRLVPDYRALWNKRTIPDDQFIIEKREEIYKQMVGIYGKMSQWFLRERKGKLKTKRVEQGYAFEKAAYGFVGLAEQQGVDKTKWSGNFQSNFEKMFWQYLQ